MTAVIKYILAELISISLKISYLTNNICLIIIRIKG